MFTTTLFATRALEEHRFGRIRGRPDPASEPQPRYRAATSGNGIADPVHIRRLMAAAVHSIRLRESAKRPLVHISRDRIVERTTQQ
jgi:hypothetical protein